MARGDDRPTAISYAAAAVGGVLVAVLAGYLAWDALSPSAPVVLRADVAEGEVRREGSHSYVPVDVANDGDEAAAEVVVEIEAGGGAAVETVVDYLAGGESRRIVALVPGDGAGGFRAGVVSYQDP